MAREILGYNPNYDPRLTYWDRAWEPTEGRPVDSKLVKSIGGIDFAPSQILRKLQPIPNEGGTPQSGNPISNL